MIKTKDLYHHFVSKYIISYDFACCFSKLCRVGRRETLHLGREKELYHVTTY